MAFIAQEHHVEHFHAAYLRTSRPALALILAVSTTLLGAVLLLHFLAGIPIGKMTRDPIAVARVPVYTGFVSQTGILFWSASAAICIFCAVVLAKTRGDAEIKRFLFAAGLLTTVLGMDDAFLLHEKALPSIGVPELALYAGYVGFVFWFLIRFRLLILETEHVLLGMALTFFAGSVAVDLLPLGLVGHDAHYLLEDGAKLVGIASWLAYFFRVGIAVVREHASRQVAALYAVPDARHTRS